MPEGEPAAPRLRTTASRLEREIRDGHAAALDALHRAHSGLLGALLGAARERGFVGDDPLAAIAALAAPDAEVRALGGAAADLWLAFFAGLEPGESAFTSPDEQAEAQELNRRLAAVPAGERPDPGLSADLLTALGDLWQRRREAPLPGVGAGGEEALRQALAAAARTLGVDGGGDAVEVLGRLLARLRDAAEGERRRARETVAAFADFLAAVRAAADGTRGPSLPPEAQAVVDGVRQIAAERLRLGEELERTRGRIAELERERLALAEEVAERERRLAERGEAVPADERLKLYRQAFDELAAGRDHAPTLERLRAIEQVIHAPAAALARALKVCDHHHAALVQALAGLHAAAPLGDDPVRLRPRTGLLGLRRGGPDLRTLAGVVAVLHEAAADLRLYAERVRWAAGVQRLSRRVPELRAVFRELVALMADWRKKVGEAPPVSLSLPLDGSGAVLALPAVVARDLEIVGKKRSKAGKAADELVPVLESCVALYRNVLAEARGEPVQAPVVSKRESPSAAVARLGQELAALAASAESAFAEAARDGFRLGADDAALVGEEHLLRSGCQALAAACEELHALPGAPDPAGGTFPPIPAKDQPDALAQAVAVRAAWCERLDGWRFEAT